MNWWQALVIGIVEGVTEYLPVSSTAHIVLTQRLMGIQKSEASDAFAIAIQGGAILAVVGIFWSRIVKMLAGLIGRDPAGLQLLLRLLAAFVPTAIAGVVLNKLIKQHLFGLWPMVGAWFVGGAIILAVAWRMKQRRPSDGLRLAELSFAGAIAIGSMQCLGMWPGTSRSLVTILGGLLVGLSLEAALEFSFLLGGITLLAATAFDAVKHRKDLLAEYSPSVLLLGTIAAAVAAFLAVRWMIEYLKRHGWAVFGYYRIALAIAVGSAIIGGWLAP